MTRRGTGPGHAEPRATGTYIRIRLAPGLRPRIRVGPPGMTKADVAKEKARLLRNRAELERAYLAERAGADTSGGKPVTFQELGEQWTSGKLHQLHPDRVKLKRSSGDDAYRLAKHVYPTLGPKPLVAITLDDCERVLAALPQELAQSSRRHVAQLLTRILSLAVYPVKAIAASPLPRGFLPAKGARPALQLLYPDEEAKLLACTEVPLAWRVACGVLAREGFRGPSELGALTWGCLDLERGGVRLDKNKTNEPRAWALAGDTRRALVAWRRILAQKSPALVMPQARVIVGLRRTTGIDLEHGAHHLRAHLATAGVTRAELFEESPTRRPIRLHDLRATFITVSLAAGKPETWIADRTGHRSSKQIQDYRRPARRFEELHLGGLVDLVDAVPELAAVNRLAHDTGPRGGGGEMETTEQRVHEGGLEPPRLAALEPKAAATPRNARNRRETVVSLSEKRAERARSEERLAHGVAHETALLGLHLRSLDDLWDALEEDVEAAQHGTSGDRS